MGGGCLLDTRWIRLEGILDSGFVVVVVDDDYDAGLAQNEIPLCFFLVCV